MILLIMAAGSGSRYGTLKQFDKLGPRGEFLMEYSIYDAINNGFKKIVLIFFSLAGGKMIVQSVYNFVYIIFISTEDKFGIS